MAGCRFQYEELPEKLRKQVDAALGKPDGESRKVEPARRRRREPNKTETAYRAEVLERRGDVTEIRYEGLTFRMQNGHRYTPDWLVVGDTGQIECHEVKGRYALQSQQRARLAFDQARVEYPWFEWVWATRVKRGWDVDSQAKEVGR